MVFRTGVLPWQLQSPLFPNIAILMACTTQSLDRGIEIQTNPETLAMKARVLSYINAFLTRAGKANFPEIAAESMKCVINLMVMEVSAVVSVLQPRYFTNTISSVVLGSRRQHVGARARHQGDDSASGRS